MRFDPHRAAAGESSQRDFFDRPPVQPTCKSRVMHDLAIANVDSVMQITAAGCNEVRAQRRLLALRHQLFQASHCEHPPVILRSETMRPVSYVVVSGLARGVTDE